MVFKKYFQTKKGLKINKTKVMNLIGSPKIFSIRGKYGVSKCTKSLIRTNKQQRKTNQVKPQRNDKDI
jgi:hypothetical protein